MKNNIIIEEKIDTEVYIDISQLNSNIDNTIFLKLKKEKEGKCYENGFILKDTIEKLFIQNNHRVILTLQPDSSLLQNKVNNEKNKLRQITESISDSEADRIIEIATKLQKRQSLEEDLSVLPKLELSDIPDKYSLKSKKARVDGPVPIINYDAATNGIVYQNIVIPIPTLTSEELTILPLYTALVTEVGVGEINYEETQLWQSRIVGSFEASMLVRSSLSNTFLACHGPGWMYSMGIFLT